MARLTNELDILHSYHFEIATVAHVTLVDGRLSLVVVVIEVAPVNGLAVAALRLRLGSLGS